MKILQFGEKKCHKIHVGNNKTICPRLKVDKWKVQQKEQVETNKTSVEDIFDGYHTINDTGKWQKINDRTENA